jgi:hypothetical protein
VQPLNVRDEINSLLKLSVQMPLLKFWALRGDEFPILKMLARHYLAIPASSAPSERVFSLVKLVNSRLRGNLDVEKSNDMVLARKVMKRKFPQFFVDE